MTTRLTGRFSAPLALLAALILVLALAAEASAASRGLLWRAEGPEATVWLLGSVHVADESVYPLGDPIERAWEQAEVLAVEADITAPMSPEARAELARALYPQGESLRDHLSPETLAEFRRHGLDLEPYLQMRPWFAIMAAAQQRMAEMGMDPELGIDLHFLKRARQEGREVAELEGMARQLRDMSDMAESDPDGFVRFMLKDLDRMEEDLDEFMAAWKTGDAGRMERRLFQGLREEPDALPFYEQLFFERNEHMAEVIEGYLATGRDHLVIVGSGHLVGERSVVDLLRRAGYRVERL